MNKKFCVLTMYTQDIKELGVITVEYNKRRYCEKHGYDIDIRKDPDKFHTKRDYGIAHFGYEKIAAILDVIRNGNYSWIFWCGSDTMITNYNIKLEDLVDEDKHFIVANDLWSLNTDCLLVIGRIWGNEVFWSPKWCQRRKKHVFWNNSTPPVAQ